MKRRYVWPDGTVHTFDTSSLDITVRADGRIEWVCVCGVGHPIGHLVRWEPHHGIHGCCPMCEPPAKYFDTTLSRRK